MRIEEKRKQTYTQEHVDFNDLSRTTPILSFSHSTKELNSFAQKLAWKKKKIHRLSYFFTANHLKSSVDIIWLYYQRNSSPLQD